MQQVNLYSADFLPRRHYTLLSLRSCALLCGALIVLGGVIAVAQAWYVQRLRAQVVALQSQTETEQSGLTADQARLAQHVPSPALLAELDTLKGEEAARAELLAALDKVASMERRGYSGILTSLASHPVEGLWLTGISIADGDVDLSGLTRSAERVPQLVERLVQDAGFGPHGYRVLTMKADDNGLLNFQLRGRAGAEKVP